ncbi:MAG: GNAT family N-acetyltransferase [Anaerolineae bacterium]
MAKPQFTLAPVNPLHSADALELIRELDEYLLKLYPSENVYILDLSSLSAKNGLFLVGYLAGRPVACGAVVKLAAGVGEIKRLYVRPEARGQGLAKRMMARLEDEARQMGLPTLRLESGNRQPESLALYLRLGYRRIPNFGEYIGDPHSVCMEKTLD